MRVLLPNRDASFDMFLNEWEPQEAAHGRVLGGVLDVLGVPRAPVMVKADGPARLVGKAVKRVSSLGDMAETIVASYAALGEKETYIAYNTLYRHARSLGEEALADAVFRPIARQEALHLAFYTAFVGEQMDGLTLRQRSFVGWFIERFYSPVGVQRGNEQRMAGFGRMVATLTDDPETVTTKVESFAHDLLQRSGTVKPFLSPRYQRCVDLA